MAGVATFWQCGDARRAALVLFQGDSITAAGRKADATGDGPDALGSGYPLLAASAILTRTPRSWTFANRAVSGDKVPDLAARWPRDTIALEPRVLSVLVGVNDFWQRDMGYAGTAGDYESQYTALLTDTRRALPGVRILVLEPFVLRCGAVDPTWFPAFDERRAAAARVARATGATFVPLQASFDEAARRTRPEDWAPDGVHPSAAGHALIAEHWQAAFATSLPSKVED